MVSKIADMSVSIKSLKKTKERGQKQSVLEQRIKELEKENKLLKEKGFGTVRGDTVSVPKELKPVFDIAQKTVGDYFKKLKTDPTRGTIDIDDQRYVLVRASALSYDFLTTIKNLYADRGEKNAFLIGKNFLFDIAHTIGMNDARNFHSKMGLTDPIAKLSAGPVHFAYSGWAFVEILPESSPTPDDNYFLTYHHPFSFEADSWIKSGKKSDFPVCIMNAGYSSGWCEESFNIQLTAVEITCKAKGDDNCTFIMAPPAKIKEHIKKYIKKTPSGIRKKIVYDIPTFFERKKVEETLRASEERYRDLFENAIDLIQSINTKGKILYVNNSWEKTLGYTNKEIIGKSIFEFIHPDDLKHCTNQFKQILSGKQLESFEIAFITKKGKKIIAEGNTNCKFKNGKPVSTRGIFRDVTKSRKIERDIRESEEKYRNLIETMNEGLLQVDNNDKIVFVNRRFCEMIGSTQDELIGNYAYKQFLSHYGKTGKEIKKIIALRKKGISSQYETQISTKSGELKWFIIDGSPIYDTNGKVIGSIGVHTDITERKKAEEQLQKSLQEKEILLKEIHHRVKNNLQIISSMLSLQTASIRDKKAIKILKDSQNRVKSMAQIYESLYRAKNLAHINFSEYIFDLSKELIHSYLIYDKLVELKHDIKKVFLSLDLAISCGLIVNELVSNSLKYAFPVNKKGILHIGLEKKNELIKLTIGDNGIGLPDGLDFRNSKTLGLQLVILLVKQINGVIDVNLNGGTKYTITFKTTI